MLGSSEPREIGSYSGPSIKATGVIKSAGSPKGLSRSSVTGSSERINWSSPTGGGDGEVGVIVGVGSTGSSSSRLVSSSGGGSVVVAIAATYTSQSQ